MCLWAYAIWLATIAIFLGYKGESLYEEEDD